MEEVAVTTEVQRIIIITRPTTVHPVIPRLLMDGEVEIRQVPRLLVDGEEVQVRQVPHPHQAAVVEVDAPTRAQDSAEPKSAKKIKYITFPFFP